ncbi:hypothetical protein GCM10010327_61150 [Streptomyces nitrosporeus]|nr:hypothetical protein GCM10010327_61150 [Streptomyces nitrosporeus]
MEANSTSAVLPGTVAKACGVCGGAYGFRGAGIVALPGVRVSGLRTEAAGDTVRPAVAEGARGGLWSGG